MMNWQTRQEMVKVVLAKIATAIVEGVKEAGNQGAPAGHLYAALMLTGMTLEQFEQIMAGLVACKMLRKSGQLYYYVAAKEADRG